MVTYSRRQARPQVRILAPHPFLFILLALVLCSGRSWAVDAGDFDYYSPAPDTLAVAANSSDSLARVVGGHIFGVYWSTFNSNGQIGSIDGVDFRDRADGVQELATATYKTFQGVEKAIAELSVSDPVLNEWLEKIYDQLYSSSRSGDVVTKTSIAELFNKASFSTRVGYRDKGTSAVGSSVTDLLADIAWNQSRSVFSEATRLGPNGLVQPRASSPYGLMGAVREGFMGLATLMFGNETHEIMGLDYLGRDKTGVRGSWSLADITANGMQGLATLIGGRDEGEGRKAVWQWIDPTDPLNTAKIRNYEATSLFDLFHQIAWLQNSLAKLEYVFASQEDMEFKEQEKPNMDAVKDNFFGDGEGAVNPDQIKDLAGISSGIKDSFAGAGSAGDAFTAINDSQSFWFFSQDVADALDTVNSPAVASEVEDDFWDQFVQDEGGFYSLVDLSPWDVESYLGG